MITLAIAIAATLAATLLLFKNSLTDTPSPWWSKLLMPVSVTVAYAAHVTHWDFFSITFLVGMAFVITGDAVFAFDIENKNFIYGLGSFAVAYLTIITALVFGKGAVTPLLCVVAPAVYAMVAILYLKGFVFEAGSSMKIPAAAYTFVVASMVVAVTVTGSTLAVVGAFLAMYCDANIGLDSFGKHKLPYRDSFVFIPYNIGHLVLMISLLPLL